MCTSKRKTVSPKSFICRSPLATAETDPTVAIALERQSTLSSTTLSATVGKVTYRQSDQSSNQTTSNQTTSNQSRVEFDDAEDERGIHYV